MLSVATHSLLKREEIHTCRKYVYLEQPTRSRCKEPPVLGRDLEIVKR